jgi:hypothetical protein
VRSTQGQRDWFAEAVEHRYAYEPWRWFWEGPRLLGAVLSGTSPAQLYPPRLSNEPAVSDSPLFFRVDARATLFYVAALVIPLPIVSGPAVALLRAGQTFGWVFAAVIIYITLTNIVRIFVVRPRQ